MFGDEGDLVKDIARVFIFENWARFYYTAIRGGTTFLEVPEEVLEQCRQTHPDLAPLLEDTNNTEITYESCRKNVGEFVCRALDGQKYPPGKIDAALDSKAFKIELHMFSMWQRGHESYLDQHQLSFDDWMEMIVNWRLLDEVKAFQAKLEQSPSTDEADGKKTH
jgi:hypothetical protein